MTTTTTAIATAVAIAKRLASGPYGYGQDDRWGHLASGTTLGLARLAARGDGDCSSTTGSIYYLAGIIPRSTIQGTWYTGNGPQKLKATGRFRLISVGGWSLARLKASLLPGDSVWGPGHVVFSVGAGQVLSFEKTEFGRSVGGKVGDQTGLEGRIRTIYDRTRSGGWAYIARPIVTGGATVSEPAQFRLAFGNVLGRRFDPDDSWDARLPELRKVAASTRSSLLGLVECYHTEATELARGKAVERSDQGQALLYDDLKWAKLDRFNGVILDAYHGALGVELRHKASGRIINVLVVHLSPPKTTTTAQRKAQMQRILDYCQGWSDPTILMGDLNDDEASGWLKSAGFTVVAPKTMGGYSSGPDMIAVRKATLPRVHVVDTGKASDHDWLSASVAL